MLTENMKAITDVAEQIIKDNGYLTKNNLQESFNEVICTDLYNEIQLNTTKYKFLYIFCTNCMLFPTYKSDEYFCLYYQC